MQFKKTGNQQGKKSFAVVLNWTNYRVVHELVFAKGIEDLNDIRVAGKISKDKVIGSIKHVVKYLDSKLSEVTYHKNCGVAKASMSHENSLSPIFSIIERIKFPVYLSQRMDGDPLGNAPMMIASRIAEELNKTSILISYWEKIQKLCLYQTAMNSATAEE